MPPESTSQALSEPQKQYAALVYRTAHLGSEAAELVDEWRSMVEAGHLDRKDVAPVVVMLTAICRDADRTPCPCPPGVSPPEDDDGLPPSLRNARPSVRAVFRIIRDNGNETELRTKHIFAAYERTRGELIGGTTVYSALRDLIGLGLIRKDGDGWRVCE